MAMGLAVAFGQGALKPREFERAFSDGPSKVVDEAAFLGQFDLTPPAWVSGG